MHSNVCFQVGRKQFIAKLARFVFDAGFTRVHFLVFLQTTGLRKCFTTLVTFERPFSCVHFVVPFKFCSIAENLSTIIARNQLVAPVHIFMMLQV